MKKAVFKFVIPNRAFAQIPMQQGAEILSFQSQHDAFCVWALVDPMAAKVIRNFQLLRTGEAELGATNAKFIGTAQIRSGHFVCHLFELL